MWINGDNYIIWFNVWCVMFGDGNYNVFFFNICVFKVQFDVQLCCCYFYELMYGVLNVGCDNEIFWLFLLQYYLLYFYVVFGVVLVMQGIYIVEVQV